jgi:CheY-like chemotaxis protein
MVVDDDRRIRELHAKIVKTMGYAVETAADGIEALAKLPLGIDVVLLDAEMPNMDGFEVARRIREAPEYVTLPIVMVSGLEGAGVRRRAIEVGINDFVAKPVNADELRMRLRWLVELKKAYDLLGDRNARLERSVEQRTDGKAGPLRSDTSTTPTSTRCDAWPWRRSSRTPTPPATSSGSAGARPCSRKRSACRRGRWR